MTEPAPRVLTGTRAPGVMGNTFKVFKDPSTGYRLSNFEAHHYGELLRVTIAHVTDLDVGDGTVDDVYRMVQLASYEQTNLTHSRIHDIVATNIQRGCINLTRASDVTIEDVHAYSRPEGDPDLPVGFALGQYGGAQRITYRRCSARGFHRYRPNDPDGNYYPNGDGFSDEETTADITYEDCLAEDNSDGGFDTKCRGLRMIRCTARRSKRNFRYWGAGLVEDLRSEDPTEVHVWFGGGQQVMDYTLVRPVFRGGAGKPHIRIDRALPGTKVHIVDPVVEDGDTLDVRLVDTGQNAKVTFEFTRDTALRVQVDYSGAL